MGIQSLLLAVLSMGMHPMITTLQERRRRRVRKTPLSKKKRKAKNSSTTYPSPTASSRVARS